MAFSFNAQLMSDHLAKEFSKNKRINGQKVQPATKLINDEYILNNYDVTVASQATTRKSRNDEKGGKQRNNRNNNRDLSPERNKNFNILVDALSSTILSKGKEHMMDVKLIGTKDKIPVYTSKLLLASHSKVFEKIFYGNDDDDDDNNNNEYDKKKETSSIVHIVNIHNCNNIIIKIAINYLITNDIPLNSIIRKTKQTDNDDNSNTNLEEISRLIGQLEQFAITYKLKNLHDKVYWLGRRLLNLYPSLSIPLYDEINYKESSDNDDDGGGGENDDNSSNNNNNTLENYALNIIRDNPKIALSSTTSTSTKEDDDTTTATTATTSDTTPAAAAATAAATTTTIACMKNMNRLDNILKDQYIDTNEITMFYILKEWADNNTNNSCNNINKNNNNNDTIAAGTTTKNSSVTINDLCQHIQLEYIDIQTLLNEIKNCSKNLPYFNDEIINKVVTLKQKQQQQPEKTTSNNNNNIQQQVVDVVVIENSNIDIVNGVYIKTHQEDKKELLYMKPATKSDYPNIGIYLMDGNNSNKNDNNNDNKSSSSYFSMFSSSYTSSTTSTTISNDDDDNNEPHWKIATYDNNSGSSSSSANANGSCCYYKCPASIDANITQSSISGDTIIVSTIKKIPPIHGWKSVVTVVQDTQQQQKTLLVDDSASTTSSSNTSFSIKLMQMDEYITRKNKSK